MTYSGTGGAAFFGTAPAAADPGACFEVCACASRGDAASISAHPATNSLHASECAFTMSPSVNMRPLLPVLLERKLAVVLAKEIEEALVVVITEVEHPRHDLVVAARFLEAAAHDLADVALRDLALHV